MILIPLRCTSDHQKIYFDWGSNGLFFSFLYIFCGCVYIFVRLMFISIKLLVLLWQFEYSAYLFDTNKTYLNDWSTGGRYHLQIIIQPFIVNPNSQRTQLYCFNSYKNLPFKIGFDNLLLRCINGNIFYWRNKYIKKHVFYKSMREQRFLLFTFIRDVQNRIFWEHQMYRKQTVEQLYKCPSLIAKCM